MRPYASGNGDGRATRRLLAGRFPAPYAREFYQRQGATQNAAALFGTLLASALHRANNWSINAQVQKQLESTYKSQVEGAFANGQGVLVIINIQEPVREDVNGFRSQVLRSIVLKPGPSAELTLRQWRSADSFGVGPDPNCRITEQYLWLDPGS